jgi:ADP-ribosylglycohydrolase
VAASVAVAMAGGTVDEIVAAGRSVIPADSWLARCFDRAMHIVDEAGGDLWQAWDPLHKELWAAYRAANAEALPEAYALLRLTRGDFVQGIIASGNFGRDADTLCALVGTWAGAVHGTLAIPPAWIEKTRRPSGRCIQFTASLDIVDVAHQLAALIAP